jgi:hypothetical protein
VAGLFLEVIVRHIPGQGWLGDRCHRASRKEDLASLTARIWPGRQGLGLIVARGNPFLIVHESAIIQ